MCHKSLKERASETKGNIVVKHKRTETEIEKKEQHERQLKVGMYSNVPER